MRGLSNQVQKNQGFTLVEVLVALVVMSLMALLSWQGIDGISKTSKIHRQRSNEIATVQTVLAQWRTDLDHMADANLSMSLGNAASGASSAARAIEFDSRIIRITRRFSGDELRVVAWGTRQVQTPTGSAKQLMRWVSPPVQTRLQWQQAWDSAGRWGQNPGQAELVREAALLGVDDWQLFFYRNDTWSNPLSAAGSANPAATAASNPEGIRLILKLGATQSPGGSLSVDWVQPTRSGGRG